LSFVFGSAMGRQGWCGEWPELGWLPHGFKDLIIFMLALGENFENWVWWEGRHLCQIELGFFSCFQGFITWIPKVCELLEFDHLWKWQVWFVWD
jgi:hypothetical protein